MILNCIFTFAFTIVWFLIIEFSLRGFQRFRRSIYIQSKWEPVETIPHGNHETRKKIMITDGKDIDWTTTDYVRFNEKGKPIMCPFYRNLVTHWQYVPSPPKK